MEYTGWNTCSELIKNRKISCIKNIAPSVATETPQVVYQALESFKINLFTCCVLCFVFPSRADKLGIQTISKSIACMKFTGHSNFEEVSGVPAEGWQTKRLLFQVLEQILCPAFVINSRTYVAARRWFSSTQTVCLA